MSLRKLKSSATKCHLLVLAGGPQQLDMRVKLLGQREIEVGQSARRLPPCATLRISICIRTRVPMTSPWVAAVAHSSIHL